RNQHRDCPIARKNLRGEARRRGDPPVSRPVDRQRELSGLWEQARQAFAVRRPRVIRKPFETGLFSRDEVFHVLVDASARAAHSGNIWRNGGLVPVDKGDLLPQRGDRYEEYLQRTERALGTVDLQLYFQDLLHLFSRDIWHKLRDVARIGIRELGLPSG